MPDSFEAMGGPDGAPGGRHTLQPETVAVDRVRLAKLSLEETADLLIERSAAGLGGLVLTHNLEHLRQVRTSPTFQQAVEKAAFGVADGVPLVWAARLQGTPLPGRVNGTDLLMLMLERLEDTRHSVYFAGGLGDTAERAAFVASQRHPRLKIAGAHSPPEGLAHAEDVIQEEVERIVRTAPDFAFIGLPSYLQAAVGTRLLDRLPGCTVIGVGVSFSFLTGDLKRAPRWMQRYALEWLHRLAHQPAALGSRYLIRCGPLGVRVLGRALVEGYRRSRADVSTR